MLSFDSGEGGENVERAQFYFSELLLQDTSRKLDADIIKWLLDKIIPLKDTEGSYLEKAFFIALA